MRRRELKRFCIAMGIAAVLSAAIAVIMWYYGRKSF